MQSAGGGPEIRDAEHESDRGRFVPTVPVGHTLYTTEEDKIMSERDGYGPVVPWWVAAPPPDPGGGASTVSQLVVASRAV